ncbi:MAG: glycosyltransferase family 4 protein [Bacteroidota bacterium]
MKGKKILAIGTLSNIENKIFTGQSIMFDGLIAYLISKDCFVDIINISLKNNENNRWKKLLLQIILYIKCFLKQFLLLSKNSYYCAYITTAQSKIGFYRDEVFIKILKLFKVRVVTHQFGANYTDFINNLSPSLKRRLFNTLSLVDNIIVEGEYMKSQFSFLDNYEIKVKTIPNGLPAKEIDSHYCSKEYIENTPFRLIYLSNMVVSKGYFDVINAIDLLINKYNRNVYCVFAGRFMNSPDDPKQIGLNFKDLFLKIIKDKKLENHVEYHEGLYGKEKRDCFLKSHSFILPTYYTAEGQPVSIIEAMAYGAVPIVTNFRHIPLMVNEDNGCFVSPKNPEDIANRVIELMDNPTIYAEKSKKSIEIYEDKFIFSKYCERILKVLNI